MTTARTRINGVDIDQLQETIAHIEREPELARFTFRATSQWEHGARTRTEVEGFYGAGREDTSRERAFVLEGDEPDVLLGSNTAPNAVETLLHALASCLAVGFVYNAAAQGIEVEAIDFELEGNLDLRAFLGLVEPDRLRPGYDTIDVRYRVKADAPKETLEELCSYVQKTSPVVDALRNPVNVSVSMQS